MKPLPHEYTVHLRATDDTYAVLSTGDLPAVRVAAPPAYDGPGDAWPPEHLLLASVASCFVMTFRAVVRASRLSFDTLAVSADGIVGKDAGRVRFTGITLHVRVAVPAGADTSRWEQIVVKAESHCLVSASLGTPVHIEADIATTQPSPEAQPVSL